MALQYDILLYIANWPAVRRHPWKSLLVARAIENQVYVLGLNRVGNDGQQLNYSGDSAVIDPRGNYLAQAKEGAEEIIQLCLKDTYLQECRAAFPVHLDADDFTLNAQ